MRWRLENSKVSPQFRSSGASQALDLIEARLGEAEYLAGSRFTAANIIMLFLLTTVRSLLPLDLDARPNVKQ